MYNRTLMLLRIPGERQIRTVSKAKLQLLVEPIAGSSNEKLKRADSLMREAWDSMGGKLDSVEAIVANNKRRAELCGRAAGVYEELISQSKAADLLSKLVDARYLQGISLELNDRSSVDAAQAFSMAVEAFEKISAGEHEESTWKQVLQASYTRCSIALNSDPGQAIQFYEKHAQLLFESPGAGTPDKLFSIADAKWLRAIAILNPPDDNCLRTVMEYAEHGQLLEPLQNERVKKAFLDAAQAYETALFAYLKDSGDGKTNDTFGMNLAFEQMNRSFLMAGERGKGEEAVARAADEWERIKTKKKPVAGA
ncbi:MAG: hypothetical protein V1909_02065 [Candidatus Micrarchaeota archaeon]